MSSFDYSFNFTTGYLTVNPGSTYIPQIPLGQARIRSVSIPDSVVSIYDDAFAENDIKDIVIPDSVTSIGSYAFFANQITELVIPDSVTSIGSHAFYYNQIKELKLSGSVTSIGRFAFSDNSLTEVVIPDSVTSIDEYAFTDNQLTDVVISDSVTSIADRAFVGNPDLEEVSLPYHFRNKIPIDAFDPPVKYRFNGINNIDSMIGRGKLWGTREADQFTFDQFELFNKNTADRIIRFKPSQGDTIAVSSAACQSLLWTDKITLATARNAKEVRRLSRQDIDFVYFQDRGRLFFNGNGSENGWGDPDQGGIFAFMHKKPALSADDFTLLPSPSH